MIATSCAIGYVVIFVFVCMSIAIRLNPIDASRLSMPPVSSIGAVMSLEVGTSSGQKQMPPETPPMFTGKPSKGVRVLALWRYWRVRAAIASFCDAGSPILVAHNRVRWTVGMHRELVRTFFPYPIVHPSPCILASSS